MVRAKEGSKSYLYPGTVESTGHGLTVSVLVDGDGFLIQVYHPASGFSTVEPAIPGTFIEVDGGSESILITGAGISPLSGREQVDLIYVSDVRRIVEGEPFRYVGYGSLILTRRGSDTSLRGWDIRRISQ